jgi:hypothetical protein
MMRLLLVLVLIVVAISGCMEKSPSETGVSGVEKSMVYLKILSIRSADDLSSYSLKRSVIETVKINPVRINVTPKFHGLSNKSLQIVWNGTSTKESTETIADVNLSGYQACARSSTMRIVQETGKVEDTRTVHTDVYQVGNSTYVKKDNGNWTKIVASTSAETFWSQGNINNVKIIAEVINKSQAEIIGSEKIEGIDAYKLKLIKESTDYSNLYNTAQSLASQLARYPMFMPSINRTELNKTVVMEKLVWISKETYLPMKYQSSMSFKMTPEIIGALDSETSEMKRFNQSVRLGEVSVDFETKEMYHDFNKSIEINLPEEALKTHR